jgi:hypothetical protein
VSKVSKKGLDLFIMGVPQRSDFTIEPVIEEPLTDACSSNANKYEDCDR